MEQALQCTQKYFAKKYPKKIVLYIGPSGLRYSIPRAALVALKNTSTCFFHF
jgi:hypothetical protein